MLKVRVALKVLGGCVWVGRVARAAWHWCCVPQVRRLTLATRLSIDLNLIPK